MIIISGGQTGADRGALELHKSMVSTGGYAPKWFMTEKEVILPLNIFNLLDSGLKLCWKNSMNLNGRYYLWFEKKIH